MILSNDEINVFSDFYEFVINYPYICRLSACTNFSEKQKMLNLVYC